MKTVAGLFSGLDRVQLALSDLARAGFASNMVRIVASPTSAGELALQNQIGVSGQLSRTAFAEHQVQEYESRVAEGDVLVTVDVDGEDGVAYATSVLQQSDAAEIIVGSPHS